MLTKAKCKNQKRKPETKTRNIPKGRHEETLEDTLGKKLVENTG